MKVLFIDWQRIPKEARLDILKNIPIGEYMGSLPYNTRDYLSWKIAIPNPIVLSRAPIGGEYLEFRKHKVYPVDDIDFVPHSVVRGMCAWERVI